MTSWSKEIPKLKDEKGNGKKESEEESNFDLTKEGFGRRSEDQVALERGRKEIKEIIHVVGEKESVKKREPENIEHSPFEFKKVIFEDHEHEENPFRKGWDGIRTHGVFANTPVFKTSTINHSDTHPACGSRI